MKRELIESEDYSCQRSFNTPLLFRESAHCKPVEVITPIGVLTSLTVYENALTHARSLKEIHEDIATISRCAAGEKIFGFCCLYLYDHFRATRQFKCLMTSFLLLLVFIVVDHTSVDVADIFVYVVYCIVQTQTI